MSARQECMAVHSRIVTTLHDMTRSSILVIFVHSRVRVFVGLFVSGMSWVGSMRASTESGGESLSREMGQQIPIGLRSHSAVKRTRSR